jgi:hypothetical protein
MQSVRTAFLILLSFSSNAFAGAEVCVNLSEATSDHQVIKSIRKYFDVDFSCTYKACELKLISGNKYRINSIAADFSICESMTMFSSENENLFEDICIADRTAKRFHFESKGKIFGNDYNIVISYEIYKIINPNFDPKRCSFSKTYEGLISETAQIINDPDSDVIEDPESPMMKSRPYRKSKYGAFVIDNRFYEYNDTYRYNVD